MSKLLEDIKIGISPLTNRIYLGKVSSKDKSLWTSKVDCTSNFIGALLQWVPPGKTQEITCSSGEVFEVTMRRSNQNENI